ncbi:hypothetical protein Vadar_030500 [Vaccinium darrowii]|uniref:Uncharacterized protein n=1 Tax=Vaccinium darrowii TaxID=229202 RepID=A0ACB7ZML4_9ERIC|nr:hypothetical protein Vadar_030500 [Vaccinium darrowii]
MKILLEEEAEKIPIEEEIENQRAKVTTTTPITPEFGRELFLSDASLFMDDAETYEKHNREEEPNVIEQKVELHFRENASTC